MENLPRFRAYRRQWGADMTLDDLTMAGAFARVLDLIFDEYEPNDLASIAARILDKAPQIVDIRDQALRTAKTRSLLPVDEKFRDGQRVDVSSAQALEDAALQCRYEMEHFEDLARSLRGWSSGDRTPRQEVRGIEEDAEADRRERGEVSLPRPSEVAL